MSNVFFALFTIAFLWACNSDDNGITVDEGNFLIFGHFYGERSGEECVETFKITDSALYEDTIDDYCGQNLNFVQLNNDLFEQVKN